MPNSHEPARQYMEQQSSDELYRRQPHDPLAVAVGIVLVAKANLAILEVEQPAVEPETSILACRSESTVRPHRNVGKSDQSARFAAQQKRGPRLHW